MRRQGLIVGCNALYRDFTPDILVSVDPAMAEEICETGLQHKIPVWTNPTSQLKQYSNLNFIKPRLGYASGPSAIHIATSFKPTTVFLLGFDFASSTDKINNIYTGTRNYKSSNSKPIFTGNWENQITSIMAKHPKIQFVRVIDENIVFSLNTHIKNYSEITVKRFNTEHKSENV